MQIASAMVACTFLSAPLMFVSAKMVTLTHLDPKNYIGDLDSFVFNLSIVGLISTVSFEFLFSSLRVPNLTILIAVVGHWSLPVEQEVEEDPALLHYVPGYIAVSRFPGCATMVSTGLLRSTLASLPAVRVDGFGCVRITFVDGSYGAVSVPPAQEEPLLCTAVANVLCCRWLGNTKRHCRLAPRYRWYRERRRSQIGSQLSVWQRARA